MEEELRKQIELLKRENKTLKKNLATERSYSQALKTELETLRKFIGGNK